MKKAMERDILFEEFAPLVASMIRRYGTDEEIRSDLPGEIYFRLNHFLDLYDPTRGVPLRAYLIRQLSASIFTYARSRWRVKEREAEWAEVELVRELDRVVDPAADWNENIVLGDLIKQLPDALSQLSHRQREVVGLRYFENLPYDGIAERLGITVSTARSLMRHAIKQLRRWFLEAAYSY